MARSKREGHDLSSAPMPDYTIVRYATARYIVGQAGVEAAQKLIGDRFGGAVVEQIGEDLFLVRHKYQGASEIVDVKE